MKQTETVLQSPEIGGKQLPPRLSSVKKLSHTGGIS
jgi:hypothetical protein